MLGTIFMNNLIRGDIDSVDLVRRLSFNVPVRLMRNYYPINLPRCPSNFSQHEPFRVVSNNYNNLYHLIYDFLRFLSGLWALKWACLFFVCQSIDIDENNSFQ